MIALQKKGLEGRSYTELAEQVRRLAQWLVKGRVARGDHVGLLAGNRGEWIVACLAVIQTGGVIVPLDVQLADDALRHVLQDSGARLLFTTSAQAERLGRLKIRTKLRPILLDVPVDDKRGWQQLLADFAG